MTTVSPLRKTWSKKQASFVKERNPKRVTYFEPENISEKEYNISLEKTPLDLLHDSENVTEINEIDDSFFGLDNIKSVAVPHPIINDLTTSIKTLPNFKLPHTKLTNESPDPSSTRRTRVRRRRCQTQVCPAESHPLCLVSKTSDMDNQDNFQRNPMNKNDSSKSKKRCIPHGLISGTSRSPFTTFKNVARSISSFVKPPPMKCGFTTRPSTHSSSFSLADAVSQFIDEPILPRLEDVPTSALRQYLNPITNAPIEAHVPSSKSRKRHPRKCHTSIQMQTYKVSSSRSNPTVPIISRRTQPTEAEPPAQDGPECFIRQRDLRENGDFMRIAVMEMLMRKRGKLDDQKPGKARWILPPRALVSKPYKVTESGIPVRWISYSP